MSQILTVFSQNPEYKLIFNDYSEEDYFNGGVLPKDITFTQKIHWMSQIFVPDEIAIKTHADLEAIPGITCVMVVSQKPGKRDLHVVSETATKEHAIGRLLNQLGVQRENAIGVGDGHNDIDLFNAVGTKVAMGNAVEDLKKAADVIIGTVEEDGLAQYFKTLLEA